MAREPEFRYNPRVMAYGDRFGPLLLAWVIFGTAPAQAQAPTPSAPASSGRSTPPATAPAPAAPSTPSPRAASPAPATPASGASPTPAPATTEAPPESPVTTLPALTHDAERRYPGLRAARHAVAAAEARLGEATVSPYFQFTLTGSVTLAPQAHGSPIFSPDSQLPLGNTWSPILRAGIQGAIPLWTFGKISSARDAAHAGVRAADYGVDQARAGLRYDVRRAYYGLEMSLDIEQMIGEGREKLESAIHRLDDRIAAGDPDVNQMDRWRLSSTLAEVDARQSQAEQLEATSRDALGHLTGHHTIHVPDCPLEPLDFHLRSRSEYEADAVTHRPESRMLNAAIAAREAALTATRAGFWPDMALVGEISDSWGPGITNQTNPFVIDPANYTSLGAAIVARWSLDFWGDAYRTGRATAQLSQIRSQAAEARLGIRTEVDAIYHQVEDANRRVAAWGRGYHDTRSWFVAAAEAYQVGTLEPKDLVDAIRAYFTARYNHVQAILDYDTALAALAQATGTSLLPEGQWGGSCQE